MCASCATRSTAEFERGAEGTFPSPRSVESFFVAVPGATRIDDQRRIRRGDAVRVTVVRLGEAPRAEFRRGAPEAAHRDTAALAVNVTPWRHGADGPIPVGIVWNGEVLESAPRPPYWALVVDREHGWSMREQASLLPQAARDEYRLALGAFYPLVRDGMNVAGRYPGARFRAARVAVGGNRRETIVVATGGSRVGPGPERAGLTTIELADVMADAGATWALNLDGGRSAFVELPGGKVLPDGIPLRRPGSVILFTNIDRN